MFDMKLEGGDLETRMTCLVEYLYCENAYYPLAQGLAHGWHSAVPVKGGSSLSFKAIEKNHQLKPRVSHQKEPR